MTLQTPPKPPPPHVSPAGMWLSKLALRIIQFALSVAIIGLVASILNTGLWSIATLVCIMPQVRAFRVFSPLNVAILINIPLINRPSSRQSGPSPRPSASSSAVATAASTLAPTSRSTCSSGSDSSAAPSRSGCSASPPLPCGRRDHRTGAAALTLVSMPARGRGRPRQGRAPGVTPMGRRGMMMIRRDTAVRRDIVARPRRHRLRELQVTMMMSWGL